MNSNLSWDSPLLNTPAPTTITPFYLSQRSPAIMRYFPMGGGGLQFHQVGSLLNGRRRLNVPIKGSEVVILSDNPFLCEHDMNPGVFPSAVSISLTLLLCSPSSTPKLLHTKQRESRTPQHLMFKPQRRWRHLRYYINQYAPL